MDGEVNHTAEDAEFPLDSYIAVYEWIGFWAGTARDWEQRKIAQTAYDALTEVGIFMRDIMRTMADEQSPDRADTEHR